MPRHRKCRRICSMPQTDGFEPIRDNGTLYDEVVLNIDEYEVIRLIDFEKLTQEQCAVQMVVSRTTITSIYDGARFKVADALINGKKLIIAGGQFVLCEHNGECCGKGCKHNCFNEEKKHCIKECSQLSDRMKIILWRKNKMKIAATYENGEIFQHFGHTEQFKIYEVAEGKVISSEVVSTMGNGHGALAGFLKECNVNTLICGGIGGGAKMALEEAGITLYGGVCGDADSSVEELLKNELNYNSDATCSHHHDEEDSCGEHSCSSH